MLKIVVLIIRGKINFSFKNDHLKINDFSCKCKFDNVRKLIRYYEFRADICLISANEALILLICSCHILFRYIICSYVIFRK